MKFLLSSLLVLASSASAQFTKPRVEDTNMNTGSSKCSKKMYECSGEPKYNPRHSPNLKFNEDLWYDMEGYWVGTMNRYDENAQPVGEQHIARSDPGFGAIPYPQTDVMMFVNMTVRETRVYKHVYYVYKAASEEFCAEEVPAGTLNVILPGVCGFNGYVASTTKFAVANWEKDGEADIFTHTDTNDAPVIGAGRRLQTSDGRETGTIRASGGSLVTSIMGSGHVSRNTFSNCV